jgi:hypothetical protein
MKTNRNVLKAVAAAMLSLTAGYVGATGQQDLTVTATVSTICRFTTGSAITVDFGTIDPSNTGAKTQPVSVPYKCTKGTTAPAITIVSGATTMVNGTDATTLAYSLGTWTTAAGAGFAAAATNATTTATLAQADYQAATAGSYTGTATLEISN